MSQKITIKKETVIFLAFDNIEKLCKLDDELNDYYNTVQLNDLMKIKTIRFYLSEKYLTGEIFVKQKILSLIKNINFYCDFLSLLRRGHDAIIITRYDLLIQACDAITEMGNEIKNFQKFFKNACANYNVNDKLFKSWKDEYLPKDKWSDVEHGIYTVVFEIFNLSTEIVAGQKVSKEFNDHYKNLGFYVRILSHNRAGLW